METSLTNFGGSIPTGTLGNASYTDLNQLNNIRELGGENQNAALKELSKQFESILVNMMLKSMRDANAVFEEGSMFQSNEMDFYRDMMDNEMALHMSQGRGFGLADSFYQQMVRQFQVDEYQNAAEDADLKPLEANFRRQPTPIVQNHGSSNTASNAASNERDIFNFVDQADFVKKIYPHARAAAQQLGLDPSVLVAQSALETGWGQHVIKGQSGDSSYNLFNIKADNRWEGEKMAVATLEFRNGSMKPERAAFRSYQNFEESMNDYVNFVQGEARYQDALQQVQNPKDYIKALHEAGYATDPDYAEKVIRLLKDDSITAFGEKN